MHQWDIWVVEQAHARKETNPAQPNDPSDYNRMYVIVADPSGRNTSICCPIQNSLGGAGITEVLIAKDCKVVCHDIFTLPRKFFEKKVGHIRPPEQTEIQTALISVLDLS